MLTKIKSIFNKPVLTGNELPKLTEFPKSGYTHYWEITPGWDTDLQEVTATIRFYKYSGGLSETFFFHNKEDSKLQEQLSTAIRTQMTNYKR